MKLILINSFLSNSLAEKEKVNFLDQKTLYSTFH